MIPLRDSTPSNSFPLITVSLVVINLFIFWQETFLGMQGIQELFNLFGLVPARYTGVQLAPAGYLPFLTSMFLHGSWMHVIGNMWILWLFGDNVEDRMGKGRFLIFYIVCGLAAALTHYYINPTSPVPVVGEIGRASCRERV